MTGPVCFGVCCPLHGSCRRYRDVDGCSPNATRIVTCSSGRDSFPLFQAADQLPLTGSELAFDGVDPVSEGEIS